VSAGLVAPLRALSAPGRQSAVHRLAATKFLMRRFLRKRFAAASLLGRACPPTRSLPGSVNSNSVPHGLSPGRVTMTQTGIANVRNSFGVFGNVVGN
jgi:hypothetical protein